MGKKKFADVKGMARRVERSVEVCLDGALTAEIEDLERRKARMGRWQPSSLSEQDPRAEVDAQLEELRTRQRESVHTFRFRALSARAYSDLRAVHRPREEDRRDGLTFNVETFPTALIAACCVDPEMTEDEAGELLEELSAGQRDELFVGAWGANERPVSIPFSSTGSGKTQT